MAARQVHGLVALFALLCAWSLSSIVMVQDISVGLAEAAPAFTMPSSVSAEVAVCADCWTKDALGPVKEGESGRPQVTCEAVLAQGYWGQVEVTDELKHPERLCVALEWPAAAGALQGVGSLKCDVEVERVLGRLGSGAASVGITYSYDLLNPHQPPKVTLEGKLCPSSLKDLPSTVGAEVRKGIAATKGPVDTIAKKVGEEVHKGIADTIAKEARRIKRIKDHLKNPFHHH